MSDLEHLIDSLSRLAKDRMGSPVTFRDLLQALQEAEDRSESLRYEDSMGPDL